MPLRLTSPFVSLAALAVLGAAPTHAAPGSPLQAPSDVAFGLTRVSFSESYAPESLVTRLSALERYLLDWRWSLTDTSQLQLRLNRGSYQIADQDFPGTLHQRSETGLLLAHLTRTPFLGGSYSYGLGYGLQTLSVDSTARTPGNEPAFLFAPWQAHHGPTLVGGTRMPLAGPFGLALDAEVVPYAFAHLGDARLAMPWLATLRLAPRVTFWHERGALGYFYERAIGNGFDREASGVIATLSLMGR